MRSTTTVLFAALALALPSAAEELTLERIFGDPSLSGPSPRALKLSPDGRLVTFLKARETDRQRLDLWAHDVEQGRQRMLVDSSLLAPDEGELSDEEKARRERQRIAALRGIVQYDFSRDGRRLLFPLGGDLYVYDLEAPPEDALRRLTETAAFETDARFSRTGRYVGYVREQDLFVYDLEAGAERALTRGGGDTLKYGMAEFVAQEEMARYTGYWFAPDDSKVAYTRVDESRVAVENRMELYADGLRTHAQRYPRAGTANAVVRLFVRDLETGETVEVDLGEDDDIYLARVDWFPDGRQLAVQRQSRDQRTLELLKVDTTTGKGQVLLTETGETWVELHDDLHFLEKSDRFIWRSARSGYDHLYLYRNDGRLLRPLTRGPWVVTGGRRAGGLKAVDERAGWIYFTGTFDSPLERHLYRGRLDTTTTDPRRLTESPGRHAITMDRAATLFLDTFSGPTTPPRVALHRADGSRLAWIEENRLDASHPYHPYLARHGTREYGTLDAADGQTLHWSMTKPFDFDPSRKYPVLVAVYGGPGGQRVHRGWGSAIEQWWVRQGYLVFSLDNRGTGYRGTAFDAPLYKRMGSVEVRDQAEGVRHLRRLKYVDGDRIGIYGGSYGGYMALMCAMRTPELYAAAVALAPVTDWRLYDTHYTERYMGHPGPDAAAYDDASVLTHYERLRSPLLIVHGMADDNVLFRHSTTLFQALQTANIPFEMMTYPGTKHGLTRSRETGLHVYGTVARFFRRHLRPDDAANRAD